MSADLKALDGNALVARLAVVKERVLREDRIAWGGGPVGRSDGGSKREDTEAVLDECAIRLLGTPVDPSGVGAAVAGAGELVRELTDAGSLSAVRPLGEPDAVSLAGAGATIERLRGLIRAVAGPNSSAPPGLEGPDCPRSDGHCWWCGINLEPGAGAPDPHEPGCPWPALVAEAGKP